MANDLKLCWHPDFGAVLCIEGDSEEDIADVIKNCPFVPDSAKVRFCDGRKLCTTRDRLLHATRNWLLHTARYWFLKKCKCFSVLKKLVPHFGK